MGFIVNLIWLSLAILFFLSVKYILRKELSVPDEADYPTGPPFPPVTGPIREVSAHRKLPGEPFQCTCGDETQMGVVHCEDKDCYPVEELENEALNDGTGQSEASE